MDTPILQVVLRSGQFKGEVQFRIDNILSEGDHNSRNGMLLENSKIEVQEECGWGSYARGAVFALQKVGRKLHQVGVAYLLAIENANDLNVSWSENIELDRLIENEYLGLKNGVLDQSAILLSQHTCLTCINCKVKLEGALARRSEHYFSENSRVFAGVKAWSCGDLEEFGRLMSESGLSSIQNYECGCEPLIQLYEILLRAPGVFGARFSGAGFRGCCVAFVATEFAHDAALFVWEEYQKVQPELAAHMEEAHAVLICESGDKAHII